MSSKPDIIGFGSVSVDEYIYVDQRIDADKGRVVSRSVDYGGNCATALVAAAVLGAGVGYVGWLSSDPADAHLVEHLRALGVDVSNASLSPAAHPIKATILVDCDGDRFIAYQDGGEIESPLALTDQACSGARFLHVDSYANNSLVSIRRARELGLIVVGDVEWSVGEASDQLRELCHHLVVPIAHAKEIAQTCDPRAMLDALWDRSRVAVVITCGDEGAYLRYGNEPEHWHQPAFSVAAIDTTACGDCFHGAYEVGLSLEYDLLHCVQFAAAAAAITATHQGGQAAVVHATLDKVLAMLASPDAPEATRL